MVIKKFNRLESAQKNHASRCWCNMHAHQFWWACTSPVSEILLPSKTANFPFLTMDYSPWSSKNLIDRNQLKKIMQVGVDVTCMDTNFGGCSLLWFRRYCYLQRRPFFPFWPWTVIVHGHQNILIDRNQLEQIHTSMWLMSHAWTPILVDVAFSGFRDTATFKDGDFSLSDHGL